MHTRRVARMVRGALDCSGRSRHSTHVRGCGYADGQALMSEKGFCAQSGNTTHTASTAR